MNNKQILDDLRLLNISEIRIDEPMYKHTTMKVGGPAKFYVRISNEKDLLNLIKYIKKNKIPYFILGNGSNILFADRAYEGIVIDMKKMNNFKIDGDKVEAEAGVLLPSLAFQTANNGLSGLEFASGIPGTIGGATFMNAGAYNEAMDFIISEVLVLNDDLEEIWLNKEQMMFSYRHSILSNNPNWIVVKVRMQLTFGDKEEIKELMQIRKNKRIQTQPLDKPSVGSIFKNPENYFVWQIIDDCELRGFTIGGAQISNKHANFIINLGYASSRDIMELINYVKHNAYEKCKIKLTPEVIFVNWNEDN